MPVARPGPHAASVLALGLALAAGPAAAEGSAAAAGSEEGGSPRVKLEKLLELPASRDYSVQSRGGATPGEWRARFRGVREKLEAEREALAKAEAELEELAGATDAWKVGPVLPGGGGSATSEAPLDYQLRQEIRRHREEIERLERKLRELEVEASLAGVPAEWRTPEGEGASASEGDGRETP